MTSVLPISWLQLLRAHWMYVLASLIVVGVVAGDQYLSSIVPLSVWQALRMIDFPYKASVCIPLIIAILTFALHFALKANDFRSLLIILLIIALQTNGLKLGPGLDMISFLPVFIILFLLAEALRCPSSKIELSGLMFFAMLLLILDLPYLANPIINSVTAFSLNFISVVRAMMVAFVLINLIQNERHLELAIKATIVVAIISASIGVAQIALDYFTGLSLTLVWDEYETKPTFLGTSFRASGLTAWSSWLADFLVLALPFMLFRLRNAGTPWAAVRCLVATGILIAGVIATFTYASYFACGVIIALFPFFWWPHRTVHFLITILFVGAILFALGGFDWAGEFFAKSIMSSAGMVERKVYLQAALEQLIRDPWLGSGFYAEQAFSENFYLKRVHNTGLQAWVNLGLPGFIVFMTMILTVFTQLWLLALSRRGRIRQLFQALALGMIGIFVEMFAEPHLSSPIVWYFLGLSQAAIRIWNYPGHSSAVLSKRYPSHASR